MPAYSGSLWMKPGSKDPKATIKRKRADRPTSGEASGAKFLPYRSG